MTNITQLKLDTYGENMVLPESRKGGYSAVRKPLSVSVEMISGRMVKEVRGSVWTISYQYGLMNDEDKNRFIGICEKGTVSPIGCEFLMPNGETKSSMFFVTGWKPPTFYWSRDVDGNPVAMWGNYSISLREVKPSD